MIHTLTADDVGGDLTKIDTRQPPSTMHDDDFADVVGKKPVVLLFATPALCSSRVCGPVADIAEQVKSERGDEASFILQEIYNDNEVDKGVREQVKAYNLPSEPWLFVIGDRRQDLDRDRGGLQRGRAQRGPRQGHPGLAPRRPPAALARRPLAAALELLPARLAGVDRLQAAQLGHEDLVRAALVPVVVVGAAGPEHVLDDDVGLADADAAVAARARVELLRDAADQPRLVALGGEAEQRLTPVWQVVEHDRAPLSRPAELGASPGARSRDPL